MTPRDDLRALAEKLRAKAEFWYGYRDGAGGYAKFGSNEAHAHDEITTKYVAEDPSDRRVAVDLSLALDEWDALMRALAAAQETPHPLQQLAEAQVELPAAEAKILWDNRFALYGEAQETPQEPEVIWPERGDCTCDWIRYEEMSQRDPACPRHKDSPDPPSRTQLRAYPIPSSTQTLVDSVAYVAQETPAALTSACELCHQMAARWCEQCARAYLETPAARPAEEEAFPYRYSGDASEGFWAAVNANGDNELYSRACALQVAENAVLNGLNQISERSPAPPATEPVLKWKTCLSCGVPALDTDETCIECDGVRFTAPGGPTR